MQRNEQKLIIVTKKRDFKENIVSVQYSDDGLDVKTPVGCNRFELPGTTDPAIQKKRMGLDELELTGQFDIIDAEHPSDYVYDSVAMTATLDPIVYPVFNGKKVATRADVKKITKRRIKGYYTDADGDDEEFKFLRHAVNGTAAQKTAAAAKHQLIETIAEEGKRFIQDNGL